MQEMYVIDERGITGDFSVDNLISIDEGSASKWQFSVEHFGVSLLTNQVNKR